MLHHKWPWAEILQRILKVKGKLLTAISFCSKSLARCKRSRLFLAIHSRDPSRRDSIARILFRNFRLSCMFCCTRIYMPKHSSLVVMTRKALVAWISETAGTNSLGAAGGRCRTLPKGRIPKNKEKCRIISVRCDFIRTLCMQIALLHHFEIKITLLLFNV
jgi:hypothetical protein